MRGRARILIPLLIGSNIIMAIVVVSILLLKTDILSTLGVSFSEPPAGLNVTIHTPPMVETGSEFELVVSIENIGDDNIVVDEILFPKQLLDALVVKKVFPGSLNQKHYGDTSGFVIDFILTPQQEMNFGFTVQAMEEVDFQGNLEVKAGELREIGGTRVVITAVTPEIVQATATGVEGPEFEIPYQSVVKITALYEENGRLVEGWSGSGSIISADGLILTNAHVVLPDRFFPVDALLISLTTQPEQLPVATYYAEVMQADWALDVAVIRIISDLSENPLDQPQLDLPVVPIGDSDQFQLGDSLQILGYPGIGGGTITLTRGEVSGFTSEAGYGERAFIKTSGTIAGGNSGGLVTDRFGRLVAIPTQLGYGGEDQFVDCRVIADTNRDGEIDDTDNCVPTGGFINAMRPINLALPLIEAAKRGEYNIIEQPKPDLELPEGNVMLYSDDFSDPNSGWSHDADTDGFVGYRNGEYLVQVDMEDYLFWGLALGTFSDTVITVNARVVAPVGDGEYGIICRYIDKYNFYAMTITEDGWYSIWKLDDDEFTALLDWEYSRDIPQYGTMEITAMCISNNLALAVDDVVLGNVTDYSFTSGRIGLFAGTWEESGLQVAFDDLEAKSP